MKISKESSGINLVDSENSIYIWIFRVVSLFSYQCSFINTGLKAVVDLFYFVTAVGCFCCPRSRRLDYNITIGSGCQHYFSSFLLFFWKFLLFHQESQCLCGFAAFYIYNKISHFAEFYCIFCILSVFINTFQMRIAFMAASFL